MKHGSREAFTRYKIIESKGNAKPKIDIRLLAYVRVYQLQCSYYFGCNIIIIHIFQNVNASREALKRYYIKYHVLTL